MRTRGAQLGRQLFDSFTLGGGQFCTKPGIVFVPLRETIGEFSNALGAAVAQSSPFVLLTPRIGDEFNNAVVDRQHYADLRLAARASDSHDAPGVRGQPILFETSAKSFLSNPDLEKEIFGPTTLRSFRSKTRTPECSTCPGRAIDYYYPRGRG